MTSCLTGQVLRNTDKKKDMRIEERDGKKRKVKKTYIYDKVEK